MGALYSNNITNVPVKFEWLAQADVKDRVIYNGTEGALCDTLLKVKYNNVQLFIDVQQGVDKKSDSVFVLMILKLRPIAQKWIYNHYGKELQFIQSDRAYNMSIVWDNQKEKY